MLRLAAIMAMEAGIQATLSPLQTILEYTQMERYQQASGMGRYFARYGQLGYVALYGSLMLGGFVLFLRRKITGERRILVITLVAWIVGVGLLVFWGHGRAVTRAYSYSVVPLASIVALMFLSRKLLIPVMCLFVALFLFANYGALAGFGQVATSAFRGAQFFALEVRPQERYFAHFNAKLTLYHDPNLIRVPIIVSKDFITYSLEEGDVSPLDEYQYVVFSKLLSNEVRFQWGEDPYLAWPQTVGGQQAALIYDSGHFQIYQNDLAEGS